MRNTSGPVNPGDVTTLSARNFRRVAAFIEAELGIQMPDSKALMIKGRLARRTRQLGLNSIDDYCELLFSPGGTISERRHLFDAVTTNKTDFFREPAHFKLLAATVLPALESTRRSSIAVWSAACSSGEEPYTLAMVLSEYAAAHPGFGFRILGTDISTKVLEHAKTGIYTKAHVAQVPVEYKRKYLLSGNDKTAALVRIAPTLRQSVGFQRINFMDANYGLLETFEIIFCRNVLIYFDRPVQEAVINKLCQQLAPGGYLFIGLCETLSGLDVPVESIGLSCYRKPPAPESLFGGTA
jgi:chemotaxis protein methyltransferase CheR